MASQSMASSAIRARVKSRVDVGTNRRGKIGPRVENEAHNPLNSQAIQSMASPKLTELMA
jgi:hypothetical protein